MKENLMNGIKTSPETIRPAALSVAPDPLVISGRKKTKNENVALRSINEGKDSGRNVSIALGLFGALLFGFWLYTNDGSATSMLLLMAGITLPCVAIMLYFFTPERYVREEVCDALAISSLISLNRVLSSPLIASRGIYVPSDEKGTVKLFLPLSNADATEFSLVGDSLFNGSGPVKGLSLQPPGLGLYKQARSIGAAFTTEGLDHQVKDVMENGLELAGSVSVKPWDKIIVVELHDLANVDLCRQVREEDPAICTRMGCPVCSGIACMIAEGTGRKVWIGSVNVDGKTIKATYELI